MKTNKISIVIPVYCNEGSLGLLYDRLEKLKSNLLNKLNVLTEIIFIDDGSTDNSWKILKSLKSKDNNIKLIQLTRNFGGVNAVKVGFQHVTGSAFTMLAADLQDPPELIFKMTRKWLDGEKFIICERDGRDDATTKKIFAKLYYILVRFFIIKSYPKGGFDLALMDQIFLDYLKSSSKGSFPPILAYWLGFKPFIIKYKRLKRLHGKPSWNFSKNINTFFDIFYGFSNVPIRFITFIGIVIIFISIIYAVALVYAKYAVDSSAPGFTALMLTILFTSGFIIFSLGVIGEYLWKILNEVNKRPEAMISESLLD